MRMQWEKANKVCKDGQSVKGAFHTGPVCSEIGLAYSLQARGPSQPGSSWNSMPFP